MQSVKPVILTVNLHLGIKILNPLSFPRGEVQPRRRENKPSSITRKFDTLGNEAKDRSALLREQQYIKVIIKTTKALNG